MIIEVVQIGRILTRTCGFLGSVVSHSLQPYRGCAFGKSLCGVGYHYIDGDGSPHGKGSRTLKTPLPLAMAKMDPESTTLEYRERIAKIARRYFPGKVGVNAWG